MEGAQGGGSRDSGGFEASNERVAARGLGTNPMFTGAWIVELMLRPSPGRHTGTVGATRFRHGLAFSAGLTLLTTVVSPGDFGVRLWHRVAG